MDGDEKVAGNGDDSKGSVDSKGGDSVKGGVERGEVKR